MAVRISRKEKSRIISVHFSGIISLNDVERMVRQSGFLIREFGLNHILISLKEVKIIPRFFDVLTISSQIIGNHKLAILLLPDQDFKVKIHTKSFDQNANFGIFHKKKNAKQWLKKPEVIQKTKALIS